MKFYSYLWLREDTTPYYAGKGSGRRAFSSAAHGVHCPKDKSRILIFCHATESDAFESERSFIKWFGRKDLGTGILRNLTDGGDGPSGHVHSVEQKAKISRALRGNQFANGHRWRLSETTKAKMSASWARRVPRRGFSLTPEHKAKIGAKSQGRRLSAESRRKISNAAIGRRPSDLAREHMRAAQIGRKHTLETRIKMSASQKARFVCCLT